MKKILTIVCLTSTLLNPVAAETISGIHFSHDDWEIACDNTRTCRAAGYQSDGDELTLSLLLTRKAGPSTETTAQLIIGDAIDENIPSSVEMKINSQSYGNINLRNANLSNSQRDALLKVLPKSSRIEFVHDNKTWHLSDQGATAVLLKMDEFQGRVDTPGALVRKGKKNENTVLASIPAPVIQKAPTIDSTPALSADFINSIQQSIMASDCDIETTPDQPEISITSINEKYLLVSQPCWLAAYNAGSSYWLINSTPPHNAVLITDSGTDYENGVISESHKGRGLGDCWSTKSWVWNGKSFVLSEESTTGMCKMVTAGGAWNLPTYVSNVQESK